MILQKITGTLLTGFCLAVVWTGQVWAQGDQILDGIGETGLIARYVFDGDARDWSRNNLHAGIHGSDVKFIKDSRFGEVLSLSGSDDAFITLPGEALGGIESLSVTGWIYLRSDRKGQCFFEFGTGSGTYLSLAPAGMGNVPECVAAITENGKPAVRTVAPVPARNKWVHVAVVMDVPSGSMRLYLDGKKADETGNMAFVPDEYDTLFIGKGRNAGDPGLDAAVHDFRLYRVPLQDRQVARIYFNALKNVRQDLVKMGKAEDDLQKFDAGTPQLYNRYLVEVAGIEAETRTGHLPRLPRYVPGTYEKGMSGPDVRVIWPAPADNSDVLQPGQYTVTGRVPGTGFRPGAVVTVKAGNLPEPPEIGLQPFALDQVSLDPDTQGNSTRFIENRDKFIRTLAETDPDSFLYMFRNAFGQEQPEGAKPLGVWDSQETKLRGHATGHYLTAIAQAYAGTGHDPALREKFRQKMDYMVEELYALARLSGSPGREGQDYVSDPTAVPPGPGKEDYDSDLSESGIRTDYRNWGKGYISAYPPDQFIMLEKGATYGGQASQVWAPYYTLHKILAGLMDIYEVSGNKKALDIASGMSDWVYARLSRLEEETLIKMWNTYIAGEFGGMNEAMARLYRLTGEERYLRAARLFDNIDMFFGDAGHSHGLAGNVDTFRGLHANQHIPQIVGALEIYRDSDMAEYYRVADNFWNKATGDYMYSIGGVAGARNPANAECFISEPATLYENGFSAGGQNETCATYNMLKLSRNLFLFDQRAELMDYYERGLYNHILASVAEDSPANTYHVPLRPGSVKHFGNPHMTGFTCCNGTAIESSTKLQNSIYFKSRDNSALYVNLYIPSTLKWNDRNITVEQATGFPREDHTLLTIRGEGKFDLKVRVPQWATKGFFVKINGREEKVEAVPGSYLTISRNWKDGDTVALQMPFAFRLEPVMDQQNIASLFYGPVLLAAQEKEPRKEWRKVSLDAGDIGKSIEGNPAALEFTIDGILFKPFYDTYGRHSVYLNVGLE
ncbi:beta-L-arabinofuranosidase domain-containing protein [Sinomicrobium soli]|uniref:beta-L-arabinofuranosidase domain-containing protein n=1 Tax=Sinomicrobium sp. N-1-3-6 TaxID=2219864 RepID=UPI000DCBA905|nr:beta-L-arabinofuranosidase domain-containing protein [Sinomicrobium sp. N-1-3-6]RAV27628.1 hypothetical protein DN748_17735 [Sinomicrobium sp. N-1-3-6]